MRPKNIIILALFVSLIYSCTAKEEHVVKVSKRQILVNNAPYLIKGVCYHPVPKGSPNKRSFNNLKEDILLMKEAGINTIRVYTPIEEVEVLDQLAENDIKVIIGFGYDQKGYYDMVSGSFIQYVNKYKNHKAILMWELGNEYNYHPEWFDGDLNNWYKALNDAAELIHLKDPNHPVTTAHGDLPDSVALKYSPNIDVWGLNVYRWDIPGSIYKEWEAISDKPMYLSEAGGDSYMTIAKEGYEQGENQKAQADANANILKEIFENNKIGSGVTLFSFTDGWWKAGSYDKQDPGGWAPNSSGVPYDGSPNEEYWGIVDIDRNKKQTFDVVKKAFTNVKK
jgi:exo-beta-1,3-glucanase (GH17 family)